MKKSLAIAYAMKKKGKKSAEGGMMQGSGHSRSHYQEGGYVDPKEVFAAGMRKKTGAPAPTPSAPDPDLDDKYKAELQKHSFADGGMASAQDSMRKAFKYAEGGQIKDNYQPSGKPHVDKEFSHEPAEFASGFMMHEGDDVKSNGPAMHESEKKLNQHAVDMMASTSMSEQDIVDRIMEKRSQDFSGLDRYAKGGSVGINMHERGVHDQEPFAPQGQSTAGHWLREKQPEKMHPAEKEKQNARNIALAKSKHSQNLETLKSMPNPKLKGLSEGGKIANQEHGYMDEDLAGFSPNEFDDLVLRDDLESSYGDDDNSGDNLGNAQEDEDRKDIVARIMASRKKKDRMPNPA